MKVKEFIEFLKAQPQDLDIAYSLYSEQILLDANDIQVVDLCYARSDGWIQDRRPDKPTTKYLLLPGN